MILFWGDVPMWFDELDIDRVANLPRTRRTEIVKQLNIDLDDATKYLPDSYDSKT